jgi:hypothetical protein
MRRGKIEEENRRQLENQRRFRIAADIVTEAWAAFPEVVAIAVTGSVARMLWKEVPRFREFRRQGIELWHECADLDLALWIESEARLYDLRRAASLALRAAYESGAETSVASHQVDVFLFEPSTDRYLGRLCTFNACPKGHRDCLVPGCGAVPFNKKVDGFAPTPDLLAFAAVLWRRGEGRVSSALDLPVPEGEGAAQGR